MLIESLHVGVLTSLRAPGLDRLLHHPFHGSLFRVDSILTRNPPRNRAHRAEFDSETVHLFRAAGVDTVVLLGYLWIVTRPLLDAFPDRILNVHDGTAKYRGLHATRDAIVAGEKSTWSIVHKVTPELDAGPVLAQSKPFSVAAFAHQAAVEGHEDILRAYAYAHREWMMRSAWGDLVVRALEEIAACAEAAV